MSKREETPAERRVRLGWRWAAGLGVLSVLLFIAGIVLESSKSAGVGGVLLVVAIVIAAATAVYMDEHNL